MPQPSRDRPTRPWVPTRFVVYPPKRKTVTRKVAGKDGVKVDKEVPAWDLRGAADGWPFFKRFDAAGTANARRKALVEGYEAHLAFDPKAVRFVTPPVERGLTVFDDTGRYVRDRWGQLEASSRTAMAANLNRCRRHLLDPAAPVPDEQTAAGIDDYLANASLRFKRKVVAADGSMLRHEPELSEAQRRGRDWLAEWSLPMTGLTFEPLQELFNRYATYQPQHKKGTAPPPRRTTKPASVRRMKADIGKWLSVARGRGVISIDPLAGVQLNIKVARTTKGVDADLVLSPQLLAELADLGANRHERYRALIIIAGVCALRPGEVFGLTRSQVTLDVAAGTGWLKLGRTKRPSTVDRDFIDEDEDPHFAPMKGREVEDTRDVPVPSWAVPILAEHLKRFVAKPPTSLVFTTPSGTPIIESNFRRDCFDKARADLVDALAGRSKAAAAHAKELAARGEPVPKLASELKPEVRAKIAQLTPHDLRHAGASAWLNAGVPNKTAQKWGGWLTLSVMLDIYAGVMPDDDDVGVARLNGYLGDASSAGAVAAAF
jgi:integrase